MYTQQFIQSSFSENGGDFPVLIISVNYNLNNPISLTPEYLHGIWWIISLFLIFFGPVWLDTNDQTYILLYIEVTLYAIVQVCL